MLKIISIQESPDSLRVQLYGEFTGESLPELEKLLSVQHAGIREITLDLCSVTFVDRAAMQYLCGAQSKRIALENLPSYVSRWMKQEGRDSSARFSFSAS